MQNKKLCPRGWLQSSTVNFTGRLNVSLVPFPLGGVVFLGGVRPRLALCVGSMLSESWM